MAPSSQEKEPPQNPGRFIVVVELGIALALLIYIALNVEAIGHVVMDMEQTQRHAAAEAIRQGLPKNSPFR